MAGIRQSLERSFTTRIDRSAGVDACWAWMGAVDKDGYGRVTGGPYRCKVAHRVAFILANGNIPSRILVCHSCDNPPCCNPAHLWLGTNRANILDAKAKGRLAKAEQTWAHKHPKRVAAIVKRMRREQPERFARGERVNTAKLDANQVIRIRALFAAGSSATTLAKLFGVSRSNVDWIVTRRSWKHVP